MPRSEGTHIHFFRDARCDHRTVIGPHGPRFYPRFEFRNLRVGQFALRRHFDVAIVLDDLQQEALLEVRDIE